MVNTEMILKDIFIGSLAFLQLVSEFYISKPQNLLL